MRKLAEADLFKVTLSIQGGTGIRNQISLQQSLCFCDCTLLPRAGRVWVECVEGGTCQTENWGVESLRLT